MKKLKRPSKSDAALDRLYTAAGKYIASVGGNAVVAGGVTIQRMPGEKFKFVLGILITGNPPPKPEPK